ncbi:MAG: hypothetical protein ACYSOS_05145, partial [Planctomycetota bacterium]
CTDFSDSEHSHGKQIAQHFFSSLNQDWVKTDLDNWRDCGWYFNCNRDSIKIELIISPMDSTQYFLQISPAYIPNIFARFANKQASANHTDVLNFSKEIHNTLLSDKRFSDIRWKWNGPPDENSSTEPLKFVG